MFRAGEATDVEIWFSQHLQLPCCRVQNTLNRTGGHTLILFCELWQFLYDDFLDLTFIDRGKVIGGLPDVVTIMEGKVRLFWA